MKAATTSGTPATGDATVGFYGGINYGNGYFGSGFTGGRWEGGVFRHNIAVVNVDAAQPFTTPTKTAPWSTP